MTTIELNLPSSPAAHTTARIIGPDVPPPEHPLVWDWQRGLDPWHRDAFAGTGVEAGTGGPRTGGWFGTDKWGNEICFVADGQ